MTVKDDTAMQDRRALITAGCIGAGIAAICCATPALTVIFGALGLAAWLAAAHALVIPAFLALVGVGLYRRRAAAHQSDKSQSP